MLEIKKKKDLIITPSLQYSITPTAITKSPSPFGDILSEQKVQRHQSQGGEHDDQIVPEFSGLQKGQQVTAIQYEVDRTHRYRC